MNTNFTRVLNVSLRGLTLAAKFGMLAFMAVSMSPADVGHYGLLTAAIGWTMYLVGWEFYTFSIREIIAQGPGHVRAIVRNQAALYAVTYLIISPIIVLVFFTDTLPARYGYWFAALLVLEHLGLEAGRVLVALSRPLLSSVVLFLRGGAWCLVAIAAMLALPQLRNLDFVLASWTAGSAVGLLLSLRTLLRLTGQTGANSINWRWIVKGLSVALPLMIASLSLRGVFTIDRVWIELIGGAEVLGAYVLFIGVATAILSFVDAGIVDFAYPRIVLAARSGKSEEFRTEMRRLAATVAGAVVFLSTVCWFGFVFFLEFLPNPVYQQNMGLLAPIVLAIALYGISSVPHLALYAHNYDGTIVASHLVAAAIFIAVIYTLNPVIGISSIPLALNVVFGVILVWKSAVCVHLFGRLTVDRD
ncbi:O antigen flippase [Agrobacterium albertimagni AOL15]|uniref:O antigen flippase n=1 Tax=Agrobacterium albertimagni AOL15 TaxID=1156935 RepID=K2Q6U2_9HYPH|nr:hypothetical protein [Agrobacterium albertimagni]EKF59374.1 O antigen flippase [Agrobacterium albertimagni AOL15]